MRDLKVDTNRKIEETEPITIPGDKSISHRVLMVAALFNNITCITNLNMGSAVTILKDVYKALEIPIEILDDGTVTVGYLNPEKLENKDVYLYAGPSSCVARFMIGILAGLNIECCIDGNKTLRARPMDFVVEPLKELGANIEYQEEWGCLPVRIKKGKLQSGKVTIKVNSAQASSGVFLAALAAKIKVEIFFKSHSRDHTQRLLDYLGCTYTKGEGFYMLDGRKPLKKLKKYHIPGDPSLVAFPIAAHLILNKKGDLKIPNVCLNSTRTGILEMFKEMGAGIQYDNVINYCGEPVGEVTVSGETTKLKPFNISGGELIHSMIDEVPLAAAILANQKSITSITDAQELEFKETNRILTTIEMLTDFGVEVKKVEGGMIIHGKSNISTTCVNSHKDHRISMAAAVLALKSETPVKIIEGTCAETSFPNFANEMRKAGFPIYEL